MERIKTKVNLNWRSVSIRLVGSRDPAMALWVFCLDLEQLFNFFSRYLCLSYYRSERSLRQWLWVKRNRYFSAICVMKAYVTPCLVSNEKAELEKSGHEILRTNFCQARHRECYDAGNGTRTVATKLLSVRSFGIALPSFLRHCRWNRMRLRMRSSASSTVSPLSASPSVGQNML